MVWWGSNFVMKEYKTLKAANPELPILVRECAGVEAKAYARFGVCPPLESMTSFERVTSVCVDTPSVPVWALPHQATTAHDFLTRNVWTTAEMGKEKSMSLAGMSPQQVATALTTLATP